MRYKIRNVSKFRKCEVCCCKKLILINTWRMWYSYTMKPNVRSTKSFLGIKDKLTIDDDFIVYGCRLFIPVSLRPTMLSRLHEAHQNISWSKARARLTMYWPEVDQDSENFVAGCGHCQHHLPSNRKETMIVRPSPSWAFQHISQQTLQHMEKNNF